MSALTRGADNCEPACVGVTHTCVRVHWATGPPTKAVDRDVRLQSPQWGCRTVRRLIAGDELWLPPPHLGPH
eukprot:5878861-Heterocapsa_arctica.AAC.1